jgi:hypothetical protein
MSTSDATNNTISIPPNIIRIRDAIDRAGYGTEPQIVDCLAVWMRLELSSSMFCGRAGAPASCRARLATDRDDGPIPPLALADNTLPESHGRGSGSVPPIIGGRTTVARAAVVLATIVGVGLLCLFGGCV